MVKAHSPLASLHASGALGGVLTFRRTRKGTAIVHTTTPHDPKTPAQLGSRALMRLLQSMWKLMFSGEKDLWKAHPQSTNQEAYLAFLQMNLLEFKTFKAPIIFRPRGAATLTWSFASPTITAKVHALTLHAGSQIGATRTAYLLYRRENGTPEETQEELIAGIYKNSNSAFDYTDIVPTLNPYGYRATRFDQLGQKSASHTYTPTAPLDE